MLILAALAKNRQQGAATTINCAVNPELNSRQAYYYEDCRRKESTADSRYISFPQRVFRTLGGNNCNKSFITVTYCRNEAYQEDMWSRTIDFLKDHLSPDALEKYGSLPERAATHDQPVEVTGREEGATETSNGETVEIGETVETQETVEVGEIAEGGETVETRETIEVGGEIAEGGKTVETGDTAENGDEQLKERKKKEDETVPTTNTNS